MADICVFPGTIRVEGGILHIVGEARTSADTIDQALSWGVSIPWSSTPLTMNQACLDAAIAAAAEVGIIVGALDNKLMVAGAVALQAIPA